MQLKTPLILLVLILLLIPITSGMNNPPLGREIITVDDEGDGDYTSIKEAVNHSNPGDIIEVYSGVYYENNITIENYLTKSFIIKGISYELGTGSDTGKPVVDGQGNRGSVFYIRNSSNISISNLFIKSRTNGIPNGIFNLWNCTNTLIENNVIEDSVTDCVYCRDSSQITISKNQVRNSTIRQGIKIRLSNDCIVMDNIVKNMGLEGIFLWEANNCLVANNTVIACNDDGIKVTGGNNIIEYNHLEGNLNGVGIHWNNNIIRYNTFINNNWSDGYFNLDLYTFPFTNTWQGNYWGRSRILPYPVRGRVLYFLPWVQFDWRPALQPYQIT